MRVTLVTNTDAGRDDYESDDEMVDTGSESEKSNRDYDDQLYGIEPKKKKKKVYVPVFVPEKEKKKSNSFLYNLHCFVTFVCFFSQLHITFALLSQSTAVGHARNVTFWQK